MTYLRKQNLGLGFEEVAKNEEIAWNKSRLQWVKYGDDNTKFFHRIATAHKGINSINVLEVDGVTITNPKDIKEVAQNSYKHVYEETKSWRSELHRHDTSVISSEEQE